MSNRTILLTTEHGSHLYGLAHANSDRDRYTVYAGANMGANDSYAYKKGARQSMTGKEDYFRIHLYRFTTMVSEGVPQALEALYSPIAETHPAFQPYFAGLRPNMEEARMRYRRTIINFGMNMGGRTGSAINNASEFKMRRHALRLCLNLSDLMTHGRFNPTLSAEQQEFISDMAHLDEDDYDDFLMGALQSAMWANS